MPSYPLLCLAAQYSQRVYTKPSGKERETHVDANWKMGTKAMVIKSVPVDDMNTIVFAIRGSQTFMDWAVNLNSAPVSPGDFLVSSIRSNLLSQLFRSLSSVFEICNIFPSQRKWPLLLSWCDQILTKSPRFHVYLQISESRSMPLRTPFLMQNQASTTLSHDEYNNLTRPPRTTPATSVILASSPLPAK